MRHGTAPIIPDQDAWPASDRLSRRRLVGHLAAAGFAAPVIAAILAVEAPAQDATPTPEEILGEIGKDSVRLRSRATDEPGLTQPDRVPWNAKGYLMNAVHEVAVTVA